MDLSILGWNFHSNIKKIRTVLLMFLVLSIAPLLMAYPTPVDYDGSILRWDIDREQPFIYYQILSEDQIDSADYSKVIDQSATLWSQVDSSYLKIQEYNADIHESLPQITINLASQIDGSNVSSGYAVFDSFDQTKPLHCTIYILIDSYLSMRSIGKTILHELGHCLGLGHSLIPESIMSYQLDKNSFALDVDDKAAITRLYPQNSDNPKLPPGCSIRAAPFIGRDSIPLWLFLTIPLLALWRPKNKKNLFRIKAKFSASDR